MWAAPNGKSGKIPVHLEPGQSARRRDTPPVGIFGLMRGLKRRWIELKPAQTSAPPQGLEALPARIVAARGLSDRTAFRAFWDPRLTDLHDPSLLPGADRAAERLLEALRRRERIAIYGDYDVDGVTATAILYHTLRRIDADADIVLYVPHRLDEGYGLNAKALISLANDGASVCVSVDCGITAIEPAAAARAAGLDLIITDHHNLASDGALPDAFALVHPRLPGSQYPFGELCGAGVAFKLAWRLATMAAGSERVSQDMRETLLNGLALAAMGAVADVVPLVDENRVMARHGLARLRSTSIEGLDALIEASRLDSNRVEAEDVGFRLGPRLNACGRLGHARDAVELLTTARGARATEIAQRLARLNDERRATERAIVEQALEMAEAAGMTSPDQRAVVLAHEAWHPGVIGICCSRLVDRLGRPTILLQKQDGQCQGSGRSVDGYSLHAALERHTHILGRYGGHDMAAGLSLPEAALAEFASSFIADANERLRPEDLSPAVHIDCEASLAELTPRAVEQLGKLGPFGRENPTPTVVVCSLRLAAAPEPLGARGRHLALRVEQDGRVLRLLAWDWGEDREKLRAGDRVSAVMRPKINTWAGRRSVEPELVDLALIS